MLLGQLTNSLVTYASFKRRTHVLSLGSTYNTVTTWLQYVLHWKPIELCLLISITDVTFENITNISCTLRYWF